MDRRLVLTTYDSMRDYQFSLCRIDWSFVIFDEAQYIKNPNALATRAAKGLKAKFRLLLTGTPVENELRDFWCIVDTARPGLLGAYQDFRTTYVRPIMSASSEEKTEVRLAVGKQLRDAVGGLMLRRLKEDHLDGLPAKTIYVGADNVTPREVYDSSLKVVMEGGQLDRYEAVISTTHEIIESDEHQAPVQPCGVYTSYGLFHCTRISLKVAFRSCQSDIGKWNRSFGSRENYRWF